MIYRVTSNNPKFKNVVFQPGFNVILAERENNTDNKQTRNGAGKTTLVEIIHFCLGATVYKNSVFKNENLRGWSFGLEIDIREERYNIERFVDDPGKIFISGKLERFSREYKYDKKHKRFYFNLNTFKEEMLEQVYGFVTSANDNSHVPTFRELISYVIRRNAEGYKNAFEFFAKQPPSSKQLCNAYFLNLNKDYAWQFQELKTRKKGLADYERAVKSGVFGDFKLNMGELSAEVISCQREVDKLKTQLDEFRVHPQYEDISKEANKQTEQLHQLTNKLVLLERLLENYKKSYGIEVADVPIKDIQDIYSEAGIIFKDSILKPLTEVMNFHKTLIENRKEYLENETRILQEEITSTKIKIKDISDMRANLMSILKSHGALSEYVALQNRYTEIVQRLEDLKRKLEDIDKLEDSKSKLKIENQELLIEARQDYKERFQERQKVGSLFEENTGYLYSEPGALKIDLDENGYSFDIEIKNSRSQGVNYMKVFCYDMLLSELGVDRDFYPDFLIHDSTIFDGVDERQVAKALMMAKKKCQQLGFQYICMINSDKIPYREFDEELKKFFYESVVLKISDNKEDGGLLGIRF